MFSGIYGIHNGSEINKIRSELLFQIHRLEKGLVLKNTRFGFGIGSINTIINLLKEYRQNFSNQKEYDLDRIKQYAESILFKYDLYHKNHNAEHSFRNHADFLVHINSSLLIESGVEQVNTSELNFVNYDEVVSSRFSCRAFTKELVKQDCLENAIKLAMNTPSVCNRQHWRVRHFTNKEAKVILKYQNGNSTFNEEINEILVVTSDLSFFRTPFERIQPYTDAGMFSMNLLNSLHRYQIGSCPLNWAASLEQNIFIDKNNFIEKHEVVVMLIAIGNYPNIVNRTMSTKIGIEDVYLNRQAKIANE